MTTPSPARPAPARAHFPALGGTAVVLAAEPDRLASACAAVRAEVAAVDAACSRFRPDSELSLVNAHAGRPMLVGRLFAEALEAALRAARLTEGAVDPTCGASLTAAGYDRDFELVRAGSATISVARPVPAPGWQSVSWDARRATVCLEPGTRLDFGATAKALAADRAACAAHRAADCGVLVSLSGDIAVQGSAPEGGWRVRVADDHRERAEDQRGDAGVPSQSIVLTVGGLATSSTTVRRWSAGNVEMHHILDPRSGRPARSCWRTVSVAAISCLDANIAATAAIVRGEPAARWLTELALPARLVREDGSVLTLAGWPAQPDLSRSDPLLGIFPS
jgi:thiamine biosynthesis lipoprotein